MQHLDSNYRAEGWYAFLIVRDLAILVIQLIMMIARFFGPGDARSIVTESPLVIRGVA